MQMKLVNTEATIGMLKKVKEDIDAYRLTEAKEDIKIICDMLRECRTPGEDSLERLRTDHPEYFSDL